jgi:hypothetical protein
LIERIIMQFEKDVNQNGEIATEVKNLIIKINNLLSHPREAEYLVDLMGDDIIARHSREQLEEVAGEMLKHPIEDPELSKKFTDLWYPLLVRFWNRYPDFPFRIEVRYEIDRPNFGERSDHKFVLAVPASSEPIIVDRLLDEMSELREGIRASNADVQEANERWIAGEPELKPWMRHFSAEQYLAKASRERISEEEWYRRIHENPSPPAHEVEG